MFSRNKPKAKSEPGNGAPMPANAGSSSATARKMSFFQTVKNYIVSKFTSSNKYDLNNVSLVNYDANDEDHSQSTTRINLPPDLRMQEALIRTLAQMVREKQSLNRAAASSSRAQVELIEIIERTFSRQLDIFDELIQVVEKDPPASKAAKKKPSETPDHLDVFVRAFIANLMAEMSKTGGLNINLPSIKPSVANAGGSDKPPGDSTHLKSPSVLCECAHVDEKGGSIPVISVWPTDKRK